MKTGILVALAAVSLVALGTVVAVTNAAPAGQTPYGGMGGYGGMHGGMMGGQYGGGMMGGGCGCANYQYCQQYMYDHNYTWNHNYSYGSGGMMG